MSQHFVILSKSFNDKIMFQNENEIKFLLAFSFCQINTRKKLSKIKSHFDDLEKAWNNSEKLRQVGLISKQEFQRISEFQSSSKINRLMEMLADFQITPIDFESTYYPPLLKEIDNPPEIIFARGDISLLKEKSITIVGSRKNTVYGERVAQKIASEISRAGIAVVSGLALGIDSIAHRAVLDHEGKTIAVLASGIDDASITPKTHFHLAKKILSSGGLLISEYFPLAPALKQNYIARNRIMAGISLGTLVIEAAQKSGSLITARFALESGREVFSVPGSIFCPQSAGTHNLIKEGAKLVCSVNDILEELDPLYNKTDLQKEDRQEELTHFSENEKKLWKILGTMPIFIDRIISLSKLNQVEVARILSKWEIEGKIVNIGQNNFVKIKT